MPYRKFMCFWGAGYSRFDGEHALTETVDMQFFTERNGYSPRDADRVRGLEIAECVNLSDWSGIHTVTRIE